MTGLLFTPFRLRDTVLRNRIVMSPMSSGLSSPDGWITPAQHDFYRARARGGTGLVIVEVTCVERRFGVSELRQLSLEGAEKLASHRALVRTIEAEGAVAGIQLQLPGRHADRRTLDGALPVAPSDVVSRRDPGVMRARGLAGEEIAHLISRFADAARLAVAAGYKLIELHGAHGYLLMAFLSPRDNRRTDRWGGSLENRLRFCLGVVRAVRAAIGPAVPLSYRLSADELMPGGLDADAMTAIAPHLVEAGVDVLHVSTGSMDNVEAITEPMSESEGWRLPLTRRLRAAAGVPVMAVGLRRPAMAEAALAAGDADLVALGRPLLADPDWANKAAAGRDDTIRPCTSCNWCVDSIMAHGAVRCAENPATGREGERPIARRPRGRAVVVGGGPGGMAAALGLDDAGFDTLLFERGARLGGGLITSAAPPLKDKIGWYHRYLVDQMGGRGIDVRLSASPAVSDIVALRPAVVILATGGIDRTLGLSGPAVVMASDLLAGDCPLPPGDGPVLVYGGGETGCETAEYLAERGAGVLLVTRSPAHQLGRAAEPLYRRKLLQRLAANPAVEILDRTEVIAAGDGTATLRRADVTTARSVRLVVIAQGREARSPLAEALARAVPEVYVIGDARAIGRIGDAVHQADRAVRNAAARQDERRGNT